MSLSLRLFRLHQKMKMVRNQRPSNRPQMGSALDMRQDGLFFLFPFLPAPGRTQPHPAMNDFTLQWQ